MITNNNKRYKHYKQKMAVRICFKNVQKKKRKKAVPQAPDHKMHAPLNNDLLKCKYVSNSDVINHYAN